MVAFIVWLALGVAFIALGVYTILSKKEVAFGFWANAKMFPVQDIRGYNHAVGKLWCVFGIIFALLGIPLLPGQNTGYIIISILGCMAEVIAAMVVYVTIIEKKYRRDIQ